MRKKSGSGKHFNVDLPTLSLIFSRVFLAVVVVVIVVVTAAVVRKAVAPSM